MKEIQTIVRALAAPPTGPAVLATLVSVEGSSYRRPGARLLVLPDGTRHGSISGGCLEEDILARAARVAATGRPELATYDTTSENDLVWGVGLGCHGIARVFIEQLPAQPPWVAALTRNFSAHRPTALAVVHTASDAALLGTCLDGEFRAKADVGSVEVFTQEVPPPTSLLICGAGDDAQPLARLASELGWRVTIADPRAASATAMRFPNADAIIVAPAVELVAKSSPPSDGLAVVMTHHYIHDVPILRALLSRPLAYLGLLGPKKRADRILSDLAREGVVVTPDQRARLHAPVGLDLGADAPEQVALAIVAEMQATLAGRNARPLRERIRPIHE